MAIAVANPLWCHPMQPEAIIERAFHEFAADTAIAPSITLRSGNELDGYGSMIAFDPDIDTISDDYLEKYCWGIAYLDPESWRHYISHLISYAIRHHRKAEIVTDFFLSSLRPPDREPPRLASLSAGQEDIIKEFLDFLAFSEDSAHQDLACQAIEEWWIPDALYRKPAHDA